jgi:hypothetical protein
MGIKLILSSINMTFKKNIGMKISHYVNDCFYDYITASCKLTLLTNYTNYCSIKSSKT